MNGYFQNGGSRCFIVNIPDTEAIAGNDRPRTGLKLLEEIDEIAIVAAPGRTDAVSHEALLAHCELNGDRVCICDPPNVTILSCSRLLNLRQSLLLLSSPNPPKGTDAGGPTSDEKPAPTSHGARPRISIGGYGACYFPWIYVNDALDTKGRSIRLWLFHPPGTWRDYGRAPMDCVESIKRRRMLLSLAQSI